MDGTGTTMSRTLLTAMLFGSLLCCAWQRCSLGGEDSAAGAGERSARPPARPVSPEPKTPVPPDARPKVDDAVSGGQDGKQEQADMSTGVPPEVELVRKDPLPRVRGKYEVGGLLATEQKFVIYCERNIGSPEIGGPEAEFRVCGWGEKPLGARVAEPWNAGRTYYWLPSPNGSVVALLLMGAPARGPLGDGSTCFASWQRSRGLISLIRGCAASVVCRTTGKRLAGSRKTRASCYCPDQRSVSRNAACPGAFWTGTS